MASTRAGRLTPGNFVCSEAQCEAPEDVIYAASSLTSCLREEAEVVDMLHQRARICVYVSI